MKKRVIILSLVLIVILCPRVLLAQKVAVVLTKDIPIYNAIFGKFL